MLETIFRLKYVYFNIFKKFFSSPPLHHILQEFNTLFLTRFRNLERRGPQTNPTFDIPFYQSNLSTGCIMETNVSHFLSTFIFFIICLSNVCSGFSHEKKRKFVIFNGSKMLYLYCTSVRAYLFKQQCIEWE